MPNLVATSVLPNYIKKRSYPFQQTVERPESSDLQRFVSAILEGHNLTAGTVTIDEVVFNTEELSSLCPGGPALTHDSSISAESFEELHALLVAAFWDGPDFICIPTPKPFVLYADHDDWITFYANTKSHLNHVIKPLASHGYKLVQNWEREL